MDIDFTATEIGSFEARGAIVFAASNFKSSDEYHYVTLRRPKPAGELLKAPVSIECDDISNGGTDLLNSCIVSSNNLSLDLPNGLPAFLDLRRIIIRYHLPPHEHEGLLTNLRRIFSDRAGSLIFTSPPAVLKDQPIRHLENDLPRQWMSDDYFDLIIWYQQDNSIYGFQLCYDKDGSPGALTWTIDRQFTHSGIDGGDTGASNIFTPILTVSHGPFPAEKVTDEFTKRSTRLSAEIRDFVLRKLSEFRPG